MSGTPSKIFPSLQEKKNCESRSSDGGDLMKVVREEPLAHSRQLRHTLVQGRDGKYYKIYTFQLYDTPPTAEFPLYEVSVTEVDASGRYRILVQLLLKRFYEKEDALKQHEALLEGGDDLLGLKAPEKGKKEEGAEH
jgi:hypothetical protein